MLTLKVKVQLSWFGPLAWLRLRLRKINIQNISGLSKVVHGQNCVVNENCLYKAILKIIIPALVENLFVGLNCEVLIESI